MPLDLLFALEPRENRKKVRDVSKGGGGGSPEERPYDVSRGQNRFVTLPLLNAQCPLAYIGYWTEVVIF